MTYQVLARKWRPRSFDTLVGQDHVVRALTHALDTQRLHHAWLFTGTRGVGKTTLSRILAKALNCEQGTSSTPCGVCQSCVEIDQGRFVDYVELDAASNRGVDEMTQLLEQAIYAPSSGRFKVYMIDEVHMLTGHAFNAMLKTLEEPPAHLKFILATTDPQKIPVTVLSRCLQFNLKQMTVPAIEQHLQLVLTQENIASEAPALRLLAQSAQGSMRDALSLTDQAISYSAGAVTTADVQSMLGTMDQAHLVQLIQAVLNHNAAQIVQLADDMLVRGLSFNRALADLAVLLSRIAIQQRVPGALPPDEPNIDAIVQLAQAITADHLQLFYSVVVHSRDELALAPDEYAGFIMAGLRLLALMPTEVQPQVQIAPPPQVDVPPQPVAAPEPALAVELKPEPAPAPEAVSVPAPVPAPALAANATREGIQAPMIERGGVAMPTPEVVMPVPEPERVPEPVKPAVNAVVAAELPPWETEVAAPVLNAATVTQQAAPAVSTVETPPAFNDEEPPPYEEPPYEEQAEQSIDHSADFTEGSAEDGNAAPQFDDAVQQAVAALGIAAAVRTTPQTLTAAQWAALAPTLNLSGWAAELAQQAEWMECNGAEIVLRVAIRSADDSHAKARINTVLNEHFGQVLQLQIEYGSTGDETAYAIAEAEREQRQHDAETDAQNNAFIADLVQRFDAQLLTESVRAK